MEEVAPQKMEITNAGLFGALAGVFVQSFSNSLRKVPLARAPHKHIACALVFGFGMDWYDKRVAVAKEQAIKRQHEKMETHYSF